MVEAPSHLAGLTRLLIQHGQVLLPVGHPLRSEQSDMNVFNDVGAQLQEGWVTKTLPKTWRLKKRVVYVSR